MPAPIVDYLKFYKWYGGGRHSYYDYLTYKKRYYEGSFQNPMGKFCNDVLTKEGKVVVAQLRLFAHGEVEKFRGARNGGVYFKWFTSHNTSDRFAVALDWLTERGYTATMELLFGHYSKQRTKKEAEEDGIKGTRYFRNRLSYGSRHYDNAEFIKIDIVYDKVDMSKFKKRRN